VRDDDRREIAEWRGHAGQIDGARQAHPVGLRRLAAIVYRDPEHGCERLGLYVTLTIGADSSAWAQRVREERRGVPRAVVAEDLHIDSGRLAAIDVAVAGTLYLIALVPGR